MLCYENFDLTYYNSYRIKSVASKVFFPENIEEVEQLFTQYSADRVLVLGHGNNIILSKNYYKDQYFVFTHLLNNCEILDRNIIQSDSGCSLKEVSLLAYGASLSGLEIFYDIPGSLGGALYMNAGSNNEDILSLTSEVIFFDLNDYKIKTISKGEITFGYRKSCFQNFNAILLRVKLVLNEGERHSVFQKMQQTKKLRWLKQPRNLPNAGSVFKRPEGYYVGTMIEQLGLKGYRIGDAQISEKHAGFIVNLGNATGSDILNLIDFIKEQVFKHFNVELELEQIII